MARIIKRGDRSAESGDGGDSAIESGTVISGSEQADGIGGVAAADDNNVGERGDGNSTRFSDSSDARSDSGESGSSARSSTRRVGRPRGSRNSSAGSGGAASKTTLQETIADTLFSLHLTASALLKVPELALSADESKKISKAMQRVSEQYETNPLSERQLAWIGLATAMGTVYGPRVLAYKIRTAKPKPALVQPIRGSATTTPVTPSQSVKPNGAAKPQSDFSALNFTPIETEIQ